MAAPATVPVIQTSIVVARTGVQVAIAAQGAPAIIAAVGVTAATIAVGYGASRLLQRGPTRKGPWSR